MERVYLARPRGFCAGVVMAVRALERAVAERGDEELVAYHDIVHNRLVVEEFRRKGVRFVEDLAVVAPLRQEGKPVTVVFSAHGVAPSVRRQAEELGLDLIDATCPLVTKVHSEAKKYAAEGYWILLIGDSADHQEVRGTFGEAPERTILVAVQGQAGRDPRLADPRTVEVPDPERVVVLTQTTLSVDETLATIELLKTRFPKLITPSRDDLCYATKNRQEAVRRLAPRVDLFLVLTSPHSSNGTRLLELARALSPRAERVERIEDLQPTWFEGVRAVGITSAASTPESLVEEVLSILKGVSPGLEIVEEGEWEDVEFREPRRRPAREAP